MERDAVFFWQNFTNDSEKTPASTFSVIFFMCSDYGRSKGLKFTVHFLKLLELN